MGFHVHQEVGIPVGQFDQGNQVQLSAAVRGQFSEDLFIQESGQLGAVDEFGDVLEKELEEFVEESGQEFFE